MSNQPSLPLAVPPAAPPPRVAPHNLEAEQALLGAILCINAATARPVSTTLLGSTCGVAADAQGFLASNGLGQLIGLGGSRAQERQFGFQFDEHLRRLMV